MKIKQKNKAFLVVSVMILGIGIIGLIFLFNKKEIVNNKVDNLVKEGISEIKTTPLKIGFITDAHCYANFDKENNKWELNWRCKMPLDAFVEKMNNNFKPDFVIENGDFVDGKDHRSKETFMEANELFSKINTPRYHVLGNHETRGFVKQEWLNDLVGYEKPYYYFDQNGYRVIVLDGNNKKNQAGEIVDTAPENESYTGLINEEQMDWLERLMDESKSYKKIVFVHQPLITEENKTQEQLFLGGRELRDLFSRNNVVAVFSGHTERFCYLNENGVSYYVLQGFWKPNRGLKKEYQFKDEGVFSEITLDKNDVNVIVYHNPEKNDEDGNGKYEKFELTAENGNCFDGKELSEDGLEKVLESD